MDIKPCPLCGWSYGTHGETTADNQTRTATFPEPENKHYVVYVFNRSAYARKKMYQKANEILNGGTVGEV